MDILFIILGLLGWTGAVFVFGRELGHVAGFAEATEEAYADAVDGPGEDERDEEDEDSEEENVPGLKEDMDEHWESEAGLDAPRMTRAEAEEACRQRCLAAQGLAPAARPNLVVSPARA